MLGWGHALSLLLVGGEAFGRLTWQGPGWVAGRRPGFRAGALESAPPRASGGQEQAGRGSPGPAARAPFPRRVLGALCSREGRRLRMTWWGSMQPLGHRVQIQGANVTEWGAPWDHPQLPSSSDKHRAEVQGGKGTCSGPHGCPRLLASQPGPRRGV